MPFKSNDAGWKQLAKEIIATEGVKRMQRVADACNEGISDDGYKVGIEGDDTLQKHDMRMTVITTTAEAIIDNGRNGTLIKNFHLAGGE